MNTSKMYLVSPDLLEGMRRKQRMEEIDRPERKVQEDLDAQMNTLLHKEDILDREKALLYNQLLHKFLQQQNSSWTGVEKTTLSQPPPKTKTTTNTTTTPIATPISSDVVPPSSEDSQQNWENQAIKSVPKIFRRKAESFLRYLKNKQVQWRDDGSVVIRDQVIPGSNIIDIVNTVMRSRSGKGIPTGTVPLIQYLKSINVPREIIGNEELLKYPPTALHTPPRTPAIEKGKRKAAIKGMANVKKWLQF